MRFLITLFLFSLLHMVSAQNSTCVDPSPLCVLNNYEYPLGSNITLTPGNSYGCISTTAAGATPVMGYYYAEIRAVGPIVLEFESENNLSVATWGPFANVAAAASSCGSLPTPFDCSADPSTNTESITISGQVGQFFLIFVKGNPPPGYVGQFSVSQTNTYNPSAGGLACRNFGDAVIACPGNVAIIECDDDIPSPHETAFAFVNAGGNVDNLCTDRIAITYDEYENGGNGCTGNPRILERRYWLQDQCGNLATCLQQFSYPILDEPLELSCPASDAPTQLVTCLDDLVVNVEDITAENACGIELSFDIGEPVINDASLGLECDLTCLHYPVTVTDECGRVGECTLSFTVFGNVPEFLYDESEEDEDCRLASLDVDCRDGVENNLENWLDTLSVFSTCGNRMNLTTNYDPNNFVDVCSESAFQSQEIIITARDACGRENTCTSTINIIKTEGPKITSQARDKWVTCSQNADSIFQAYIADNGGAIAIDYCSATTFTTNPANPEYFISCEDEDGLSIEFIASDACGNSNITVGVFKVLNDAPPVVVTEAGNMTVSCTDNIEEQFNNFISSQGGAIINGCGNVNYTTDPAQPELPSINDQCDLASTEVTFIGTDECGQMVMTTGTFTVVDDTSPNVTDGENLELECNSTTNLMGINSWLESNGGINFTDACTSVSISNDFDPASLDVDCHEDPISVTFTVTDACGNEATQIVNITITDTTPPVFTFVPTELGEEPIAEDDCSDVVITSVEIVNGGQTTITYTATDACGNETSVTVTFGEVDNIPPVITFIPTEVGCDGVLDPNDITATDNSGQVNLEVVLVSEQGDCSTGYTYTYNVIATDGAGNQTTETVTYNIPADNTPPVFTSVPEDMTFFCSEEVVIPEAIATDDCDEVTITCIVTLNDGAVVDNCNNGYGYDIFKVWTATDACGNTATAVTEAWVVPDDYVGPKFDFVPESKVMECGEDAAFGEAICNTACGNVVLTYVDQIVQGDCSQAGEMIRTWTGVDDCGNVATAQQIINIPPDMEAPVFTFVPATQTIKDFDEYVPQIPVCEDNCATINHLDVDYYDEPHDEGCGFTRTWVVADLCGNTATASQTILIDDIEAPIISDVPGILEIECGESVEFSNPTITDNMSDVDITILDETLEDNCTGVNDLMRTWIARDGCGNESTFTQTIYTQDDFAPSFSAEPSDKIVSCNDSFEFDEITAYDNCGNVQSFDYVDIDLSDDNCTSCIYKVQRTWTAIDACNNEATISQTITLMDQEAPSIVITGNAVVEFPCGEELAIDMPTAFDNCGDAAITFEDILNETNCGYGESFTRTWIASDNIGNQSTATQQFVFVDNEAPIFSEEPIYIESDCMEMFEFVTPQVTDACSEVEVTFVDKDLDSDCGVGTKVERTWTATDACGNQNDFSQTIEFIDNDGPEFNIVLSNIILKCGEAIPNVENITALDNCDQDIEIRFEETAFPEMDCSEAPIISRTFTANDDCGNVTVMTYDIFREADTVPPVFSEVPEMLEFNCGEAIAFVAPQVSDNCSQVELTEDVESVNGCAGEGTMLIKVWEATDACGNVARFVQRAMRVDNQSPVVTTAIDDKQIYCGQEVVFDTPEFSDDCSSQVEISWDTTVEEDACSSSHTRSWIATDVCGNATEVSQRVYWVDDEAPEILVPLNSLEMTVDEYIKWAANPELDAEDNCSGIDIDASTIDITENNNCEDFKATYTYNMIDKCGNSNQFDFEVSMPNALPTFTLDAPLEVDCGATFTATALDIDIEANELSWSLNDQTGTWEIISNADTQIEIIAGDDAAELVLTATNKLGCATTHTQEVLCSTVNSLDQLTAIDALDLRPNPVANVLTVQFISSEGFDADFIVYDLLGRVLISQSRDVHSGDNQFELDATPLEQGTYILEISTDKGAVVKKFMKF